MATSNEIPLDAKLQAAYFRYKAATDKWAKEYEKWDSTRAFLRTILEWREKNNYADFQKNLQQLLGVKDSSVDNYLAAARFATEEVPVAGKGSVRIVDLEKHVECPSISQMAKCQSLLNSKDPGKQLAGRQALLLAIEGSKIKSVKNLEKVSKKRRFEYTIRGLAAHPDDALRAIASFMRELAALGDKQALSILESLKLAAATGGKFEVALMGIYKGRIESDIELAKEFIAPHPKDESITLSDPAELMRIQEWLLQGNGNKPKKSGAENKPGKDPDVFKQELLDRNKRMKERDRLICSFTDDAALPIFTDNDSLSNMLNGLTTSWEGQDAMSFEFVLSGASDADSASESYRKALSTMNAALDDRRIGTYLFPVVAGPTSISKLLQTKFQNGTLDQMFAQIRSRWGKSVASRFRYADIVAEDQETAVQRFDEALKILKKSLAGSPVGIVIFPRLRQGNVELRLLAERGRQKAIEQYEQGLPKIDLPAFTKEFCRAYPQIAEELAQEFSTTAYKELRKKLNGEPTEAEMIRYTWSVAWRKLKKLDENRPAWNVEQERKLKKQR